MRWYDWREISRGEPIFPARFAYVAPRSIEDAIALLSHYGTDARALAGGQSLIPLMKLRLAGPKYLVDLNRIGGLATIEETDGFLSIGALVREADVEASALLRSRYPAIADTAAVVGDPLVRNLGTIGGNLAHGDPANDHPATMLALGAEVIAQGPRGERVIPVADLFEGFFTTSLKPGEVLTRIRVPRPASGCGSAYLKLERKVGDLATAGVAAFVQLEGDVCRAAGIGLTNVGSLPIKARKAEASLVGKRLDERAFADAADLAAEEADPASDLRGPVDYKRDMVRVLTRRALRRAVERAQA
ncbi:MAG: nicotine dehydrogenase chain [Chloroflexi bacterium]|nr:nicotine dehydrogenase chain [Chloroflexota bacterium]